MSYLRDDAAHWFARAAELRTQAAALSNPEAQLKMLELAGSCTIMDSRRKPATPRSFQAMRQRRSPCLLPYTPDVEGPG